MFCCLGPAGRDKVTVLCTAENTRKEAEKIYSLPYPEKYIILERLPTLLGIERNIVKFILID